MKEVRCCTSHVTAATAIADTAEIAAIGNLGLAARTDFLIY